MSKLVPDALKFSHYQFISSRFENVPLVTPNGDLLVPNLNFEVSFLI